MFSPEIQKKRQIDLNREDDCFCPSPPGNQIIEENAPLSPSSTALALHDCAESLSLALRCPLCLSTLGGGFADICQLQCAHAFCVPCIKNSLAVNPHCPICKVKTSVRSLTETPHLSSIVKAYRSLCKSLGMAPTVWTSDCGMTQPEDGFDIEDMVSSSQQEEQLLASRRMVEALEKGVEEGKGGDSLKFKLKQQEKIRGINERQKEENIDEEDDYNCDKKGNELSENSTEGDNIIGEIDKKDVQLRAEQTKEEEDLRSAGGNKNKEKKENLFNIDPVTTTEIIATTTSSSTEKSPVTTTCPESVMHNPCLVVKDATDDTTQTGNALTKIMKSKERILPPSASPAGSDKMCDSSALTNQNSVSFPAPNLGPESTSCKTKTSLSDVYGQDKNPLSGTKPVIDDLTGNPVFPVHSIVRVEERTWSGINKPGGVARIVDFFISEDSKILYNVKYVIGGHEKNVESKYVSQIPEEMREDSSTQSSKRSSRRLSANSSSDAVNENIDPVVNSIRKTKLKKGRHLTPFIEENATAPKAKKIKVTSKNMPKVTTKTPAKQKAATKIMPKISSRDSTVSTITPKLQPRKDSEIQHFSPVPNIDNLSDSEAMRISLIRFNRLLKDAAEHPSAVLNYTTSSINDDTKKKIDEFGNLMTELKNLNLRNQREMRHAKDTVFVIAEKFDNGTAKSRTLKVLRAMINGIPIISPNWVEECIKASDLVPLDASHICTSLVMRIENKTFSRNNAIVRAAATLDNHGDKGRPFNGTGIFLVGKWKKGEGNVPDKKMTEIILGELGATVIPTAEAALKIIRGKGGATTSARSKMRRIIMICDAKVKGEAAEKSGGLGSQALLNEVHNLIGDGTDFVRVCGYSWLFDAISVFSPNLPFTSYAPEDSTMKSLWEIGNLYDVPQT